MARSKSSNRWLREHFDDPYVQLAQKQGYRSRAIFKLQELDEKDKLLRPGLTVVDLGAAPGGWSQYAGEKIGENGRIIAMDILPMDPLPKVDFILGDFRDDEPYQALQNALNGSPIDLVISDMAPNMSGMEAIDQPKSMYLLELARDFAVENLKPGGVFVSKAFQGTGIEELLSDLRAKFSKVMIRKPKASRPRSNEVYLVAKGYNKKV